MKKAITTVHTIIVIIGLLATAGWSAYYLYNQRQFNSDNNSKRIPGLVKEVSTSLDSSQSLYDRGFGESIKEIFSENKDIIALSIYSYDTGIEYFYSRNGQVSIMDMQTDAVSQNPEYKGLSFSHSIGSVPLTLKDKPGTNLDIVFTVLPRTSIFFVLKISLLAVIILFVITLILIVAFSLSKSGKKDENIDEWEKEEIEEDFTDSFAPPASEESSFADSEFADDSLPSDDDLDFSLPADESDFSEDFSTADDSVGLDSFDLPEESDMELDSFDDLAGDSDDLSLDGLDDMNLEDSIPDIPDEEDLLGMDHEEVPLDQSETGIDESDDDFSFPEEEDLFDEVSSEDLDMGIDEELDDIGELSEKREDETPPSLYNPENGLGWEAFLEERLGLELERSASFDQDLVLLMIRDTGEDGIDMDQLNSIVKEVYSYQDLIFEAGKDSLALIEPNKDLDEAIADVQSLFKRIEQDMNLSSLKCGLSSRNGRLITGKRLINEADASLNKSDDENPIIGFRSDPERFREYLNQSS